MDKMLLQEVLANDAATSIFNQTSFDNVSWQRVRGTAMWGGRLILILLARMMGMTVGRHVVALSFPDPFYQWCILILICAMVLAYWPRHFRPLLQTFVLTTMAITVGLQAYSMLPGERFRRDRAMTWRDFKNIWWIYACYWLVVAAYFVGRQLRREKMSL